MRIPSYTSVLKRIPQPDKNNPPKFNKGGRLIVALVEYRIMDEIDWVINALLRVYDKPEEIGFSIVHGNINSKYLQDKYGNWSNIKLINTGHENLNRGTYSALLKTPQLWENFRDWSHVLIYQTDACIMRRIDDIYFNYDYIGSPWGKDNQWTSYNAGNGGFSLRSVSAMINSCECNRNTPFEKIHRGNEDGYFCSQTKFRYPPINSKIHKAFAMEKVKYATPIGCHQVYYNWSNTNDDWKKFLLYMEDTLINNKPYIQNIKTIEEAEQYFSCKMVDEIKIENMDKKDDTIIKKTNIDWTQVCEIEKYKYRIGPFTTYLNQKSKNNWNTACDYDYDILFCKTDDPSTVVETHHIEKRHDACIHKKKPGVKYFDDNHYVYLSFYPGFESGGCSGSDVHAPWGHNFNRCSGIPKNGGVVLRCAKDPNIREKLKQDENTREIERLKKEQLMKGGEAQDRMITHFGLTHLKNDVNVLVYDLFCGVGYYNQLFSLELGIYLANISNRHLVINMRHPLVACGKPDRNYGTLIDYLGSDFTKHLPHGYSLKKYSESMNTFANEINFSAKMSNIIIVDEDMNTAKNEIDISQFAHYRQRVSSNKLAPLFDKTSRVVSFTGSNASRFFTNFYTNKDNYTLMSKIAISVNTYSQEIMEVLNDVRKKIKGEFISIHLRFGDWHKKINQITSINGNLIDNISKWLEKNNTQNLPLYVMTDRKDNPFFNDIKKKYDIFFLDELLEPTHKTKLGIKFKNTNVAEFIVQKIICEDAKWFIGSQGSTVTTHIQYNNFLNKKDYEMHGYIKTTNYDGNTLKFKQDDKKHYSWSKKNYIGGHPVSWSMFFDDNIVEIE
jgi:hypothetical protein